MHKKLDYLEGLRGLACLVVVLDHCVNSFLPEARFTNFDGRFGDLYHIVASSPLNFIYSGVTPVFIFFILSGFVLSKKFIETGDNRVLARGAIKRYFRLIGPVVASTLAMYISVKYAAKIGVFDASQYTLKDSLYQAFIGAFIDTKPLINGPLWTMRFEFIGSLIVFLLLALTKTHDNKRSIYYFALIFFVTIGGDSYLFSLFIFGIICASDSYTREGIANINNKMLLVLMFIVSAILSTYPFPRWNVEVIGLYKYINFSENQALVHNTWHFLGAILLFTVTLNSETIKRFFSSRICVWLGKLSFSIYVMHNVVVFNLEHFIHLDLSKEKNFIIMTLITVLICILVSIPFEKFIDRKSTKASNLITAKI